MVSKDVIDTLIAEAGGEGETGMIAAAWAMQQRAAARGVTLDQVIQSGFDGFTNPGPGSRKNQQNPALRAQAERVLSGVVSNTIPNPVPGADHFLSGDNTPGWAQGMKHVATIGGHRYYASGDVPASAFGTFKQGGADAPKPQTRTAFTNASGQGYVTQYDFTPQADIRTLPLEHSVAAAISQAVYSADPKVGIRVTSGGQPEAGSPGRRTGSERHDNGGAADFQLTRDGKVLPIATNRGLYENVAKNLAALGVPGIGVDTGANFIHAGGGQQAEWGYDGKSNGFRYLDSGFRSAIADGRGLAERGGIPIPPMEVPNAVGTQLDVVQSPAAPPTPADPIVRRPTVPMAAPVPQQRLATVPNALQAPAAARVAPVVPPAVNAVEARIERPRVHQAPAVDLALSGAPFRVTPHLMPGNEDIYSYWIQDGTPTPVQRGLGSLTPFATEVTAPNIPLGPETEPRRTASVPRAMTEATRPQSYAGQEAVRSAPRAVAPGQSGFAAQEGASPPPQVAQAMPQAPSAQDLAALYAGGGPTRPQEAAAGKPMEIPSGIFRVNTGSQVGTVALPRDVRPQVPDMSKMPAPFIDTSKPAPTIQKVTAPALDKITDIGKGAEFGEFAETFKVSAYPNQTKSIGEMETTQRSPGTMTDIGAVPSWDELQELAGPKKPTAPAANKVADIVNAPKTPIPLGEMTYGARSRDSKPYQVNAVPEWGATASPPSTPNTNSVGLPFDAELGSVRMGTDGKTYQFVQTGGGVGNVTAANWMQYNPGAGGGALPNQRTHRTGSLSSQNPKATIGDMIGNALRNTPFVKLLQGQDPFDGAGGKLDRPRPFSVLDQSVVSSMTGQGLLNQASEEALQSGKHSYVGSDGAVQPTTSMDGKIRNTYGD